MNSQFWKLWTALAISNVGDGIATTAMPLLAVTLTRDPALVAGITVATRLPWLLFSLPAGALVDRLDRHWMMVITDAFRTILLLALSVLIWKNWINLPLLYLVIFLFGIAEVLFDTAAQTILPALVPKEYLNAANGYLNFGLSVPFWVNTIVISSLAFIVLPFLNNKSISDADYI